MLIMMITTQIMINIIAIARNHIITICDPDEDGICIIMKRNEYFRRVSHPALLFMSKVVDSSSKDHTNGDTNKWEPIDFEDARDKVSHSLQSAKYATYLLVNRNLLPSQCQQQRQFNDRGKKWYNPRKLYLFSTHSSNRGKESVGLL